MAKFFSDPSLTVYKITLIFFLCDKEYKITLILCEPYAYNVDLYIHLGGYKETAQKLSMITVIDFSCLLLPCLDKFVNITDAVLW